MPNRIEELFAELAENVGSQQQFQSDYQLQQMEAQRQLHDTPEARRVLEIAGIIGLLALTRGRSGGKGLTPKTHVDWTPKDLFRKFLPPRLSGTSTIGRIRPGSRVGTDVVERTGLGRLIWGPLTQTGRSGSRVGTDAVGRTSLPKVKDPVVTKQGPRGPINIDSPKQLPLKGLEDARYTKGLSETDKEMIKRILIPPLTKTGQKGIPSTTTGKATKLYMDKVKSLKSLEDKLRIDQAKINAGEAPSKNFTKMLEEAARLRALLKSLE